MELELRTIAAAPENEETERRYLQLAQTFYTNVLSHALDKVAESFVAIDSIDIFLEHSTPDPYVMLDSSCVASGMVEVCIQIPIKFTTPDGNPDQDYELSTYGLWGKRFNHKLYCTVEEPVKQFNWDLLNQIDWGIWGAWLSWDSLSVSESYRHPGKAHFYDNHNSNCFGNTDIYE